MCIGIPNPIAWDSLRTGPRFPWVVWLAPVCVCLMLGCGEGGSEPGAGGVGAGGSRKTGAGGEFTAEAEAAFEPLRQAAFALSDQDPAGDDTVAALERALAASPGAFGVNARLARAYRTRQKPELARQHFERALLARPEHAETLKDLVDLLEQLGRADEALARLAQVAQRPGEAGAEALSLQGRLAFRLGRFELAHELLDAALVRMPADRATMKGLADVCWRLGRQEQALHWQELLELFLALEDNVFTREQDSAEMERSQQQVLDRNEYVRAEVDLRMTRLELVVELHPQWGDGFLKLAALQAEQIDAATACRTVRAYLELHAGTLSVGKRRSVESLYCEDVGQ